VARTQVKEEEKCKGKNTKRPKNCREYTSGRKILQTKASRGKEQRKYLASASLKKKSRQDADKTWRNKRKATDEVRKK